MASLRVIPEHALLVSPVQEEIDVNQPSSQPSVNPAQTYEEYLVANIFGPWTSELLDRARPQPGERVLDLACGTGIVARTIARNLNGQAHIVGLDLRPAMVEVARSTAAQEGLGIEWHVGRADALPFPDASFELVVIQQGLQFFPDQAAALREVSRVLAPGGRVASATWTALSDNPFNEAFAEVIERHLGTPALHAPYSLGDRAQLHALFMEAGFEGIEIERVVRTVRLPSPDTFVDLSLTSASAAIPALQAMDAGERAALVEAVRADMASLIRDHTEGNDVVSPRTVHILVARKSA